MRGHIAHRPVHGQDGGKGHSRRTPGKAIHQGVDDIGVAGIHETGLGIVPLAVAVGFVDALLQQDIVDDRRPFRRGAAQIF